jgi:hypothetical protein
MLDSPSGPEILVGTFNKILGYSGSIYADQRARFHEALRGAEHLLVIGYGFRDKAINSRIVAWAERPGERRMVVVHPSPSALGDQARGAIRSKWKRWQVLGLLEFIPKKLTS